MQKNPAKMTAIRNAALPRPSANRDYRLVQDLIDLRVSPDGERGGTSVARKKATGNEEPKLTVVTYSFGQHTYQIDPERHKVYRRFVEIETSKAVAIYSSWRAANIHP